MSSRWNKAGVSGINERCRRFAWPSTHCRWRDGALCFTSCCSSGPIHLEWLPRDFPRDDQPLLDGADVGLFVEPPLDPALDALTVGSSPMVVLLPAGHRLARHHELRIADALAEPFFDAPHMNREWRAFWSLDSYRGGPPPTTRRAENLQSAMTAIARGDAIGTFAASLADGLPHPGIIWLPLIDGPMVATRLVWRAGDTHPAIRTLVDIARDMFGDAGGDVARTAAASG
jgi:DNA-binding transcriptional LysR family regulator